MNLIHFARLIPEQAKRYGSKTCLRYRNEKERKWYDISWTHFDRSVQQTASALLQLGVREGATVGLFSPNKPECLMVDFAVYSIRATGVPLYATSTTLQIDYVLKDAGVEVLFVGEQYHYDRAMEAMNAGCGLKQLVIFDTEVRLAVTDNSSLYYTDLLEKGRANPLEEVLKDRRANAEVTDMANIVYTSGTTGEPKGVLITHAMFLEALKANNEKLTTLSDNEVSLCFLPMTHIFEKAWDLFCLARGYRIDINQYPLNIQQTLKEVRPTVMCGVPRFWEKVYDGIWETIQQKSPLIRVYFARALQVGKRYHLDYKRKGLTPPFWIWLGYALYNRTLFRIVKHKIGLDKGVFFPVAGAKYPEYLCQFFLSMGIKTVHGYGLTESTATVSVFDATHFDLNTVGTVIPGLEVRLGEQDEIQLKGSTITPGYHNKPLETEAAFTPDGFFKTGDAGAFTENGQLIITERIKDLFKTSTGKYIAPQHLETTLCSDPYIDMAAVFGDGHQYVVALIVPNLKALSNLIKELGVETSEKKACLADERIHAFFETRIRQRQKNMAAFEQVRRFVLIDTPFSLDNNELTNTLKLRRLVIYAHYSTLIDDMYG